MSLAVSQVHNEENVQQAKSKVSFVKKEHDRDHDDDEQKKNI